MTRGFHDPDAARALGTALARTAKPFSSPFTVMEVCGTHTMEIARHGLKAFLPDKVRLVSGPGCPVCVTPDAYIDAAVALALDHGAVVATFGDMLRVPGSRGSLERARAEGGDVRVVYSPMEALSSAGNDPDRPWVFLGIGFETTTPLVAATLRRAEQEGAENFFVLSAPKTVPAALHALLDDPQTRIDGFLCPGHVSVIIGPEAYESVAGRGVPCVIAGFEPLDILQSLSQLLAQHAGKRAEVEVQYWRAVKAGGNPLALSVVEEVFEVSDGQWRGMGVIPDSGLALRGPFKRFCAAERFGVAVTGPDSNSGCSCGDVLKGLLEPCECALFGSDCLPEHPVGPCMVSSEGSCAASYRYGGGF